ncbi:MAG: hypothetical protein LBP57_00125 [Endomicrobium sp.]|jgi:type IV secretion system protein VirB8|nr:hypothetical protein [Endomicrobium sp.]
MFEKVKDGLALYNAEKRLIGFLFTICITQFAAIIVLLVVILFLFPLKEKEPYLVHFSTAEQNFVTVEKADYNIRTNQNILNALVSTYVRNRETIDQITDKERFDITRLQSASNVWRVFEEIVNTKDSIYTNKKIKREINIINIAFLKQSITSVDFIAKIINSETGTLISETRYRAVVSFGFQDQTIKAEESNKNPTSFLVQDYGVTQITIPGA